MCCPCSRRNPSSRKGGSQQRGAACGGRGASGWWGWGTPERLGTVRALGPVGPVGGHPGARPSHGSSVLPTFRWIWSSPSRKAESSLRPTRLLSIGDTGPWAPAARQAPRQPRYASGHTAEIRALYFLTHQMGIWFVLAPRGNQSSTSRTGVITAPIPKSWLSVTHRSMLP